MSKLTPEGISFSIRAVTRSIAVLCGDLSAIIDRDCQFLAPEEKEEIKKALFSLNCQLGFQQSVFKGFFFGEKEED